MAVNISKAQGAHKNTGAISSGGKYASGPGGSDGSAFRNASGRGIVGRPRFDAAVVPNGYRWWYVDALSDDGQNGLTIIGFVGSVFSPYYKRARKFGAADPEHYCAINVALYGTKKRWAMTERGRGYVVREADLFRVGPSSMQWFDNTLVIDIDERCAPLPHGLRGRVELRVEEIYDAPIAIDEAGRHFWQAVAPRARIVVELENPKSKWSGFAYHDMNWGEEPLEQAFKKWTWLRANTSSGTEVLYNVTRQDGSQFVFGRRYKNGIISTRSIPPMHQLASGIWGMTRGVVSEAKPRLLGRLEDAPFYTRNHIEMTLDGKTCEAFHESLSLERFSHPVVQLMLPFRMPRVR